MMKQHVRIASQSTRCAGDGTAYVPVSKTGFCGFNSHPAHQTNNGVKMPTEIHVTKEDFFKSCGKFLYMTENNADNWKDYYENGRILKTFGTIVYILYK